MAVPKKTILKYCVGCRREININNFNTSKNPNHGGHLPYCKDCCNEIFNENMKKSKSAEFAFYCTLAEMGVPLIREAYKSFTDDYDKRDLKYSFGGYYSKLNNNKIAREWTGFFNTDVDYNDIKGLSPHEENLKAEQEKLSLDWGRHSLEDYRLLIYWFDKYTESVDFENPQHEDLFRDLCLARLSLRKAEQGDSDDNIQRAQQRVLNLMTKLKLDDFNSNKAKSLSEQSLFNHIVMISENNVEDIYKEPRKFADFNKYIEYIKKFSLRPLANMLAGHRDFDVNLEDIHQYEFEE